MTRDACRTALERYLSQVQQLTATIARPQQLALGGPADALLESLRFEVEVDAACRDGTDLHQRLSEIELAVFVPVLRKIHGCAERLALSRASAEWLPELRVLEDDIRDALAVSDHCRRG